MIAFIILVAITALVSGIFVIGDEPGMAFAVIIIGFIVAMGVGLSESPSPQPDYNNLTREYVLKYYPEYSNCTITYEDDFYPNRIQTAVPGALIVCVEHKDHLIPIDGEKTIKLAFDNFTIQDLVKYRELKEKLP